MLSLQFVRENPDAVRKALRDRGVEEAGLDEILQLDEERRKGLTELEGLKAQRNVVGRSTGAAPPEERERLIEQGRLLSSRINELDPKTQALDERLRQLLLEMPNVPHPDTPVGAGEDDNVIVRTEGTPPEFDFEPRPHWEIGERLSIIDFERGAKLSGSRFYVLKGPGARLQRALIAWMLDLHTMQHGYTEIYPPLVVREACLW
ncbi:MAG TPA: serine--tRNA ligase, partial [Dehalococcoidia bacterium]|nr:serine--tRNA ligase [Dehalococcoidia bacterium]